MYFSKSLNVYSPGFEANLPATIIHTGAEMRIASENGNKYAQKSISYHRNSLDQTINVQ